MQTDDLAIIEFQLARQSYLIGISTADVGYPQRILLEIGADGQLLGYVEAEIRSLPTHSQYQ